MADKQSLCFVCSSQNIQKKNCTREEQQEESIRKNTVSQISDVSNNTISYQTISEQCYMIIYLVLMILLAIILVVTWMKTRIY